MCRSLFCHLNVICALLIQNSTDYFNHTEFLPSSLEVLVGHRLGQPDSCGNLSWNLPVMLLKKTFYLNLTSVCMQFALRGMYWKYTHPCTLCLTLITFLHENPIISHVRIRNYFTYTLTLGGGIWLPFIISS